MPGNKINKIEFTFVDVGRISLLAGALTLLLVVVARGGCRLLRGSGRKLEMVKLQQQSRKNALLSGFCALGRLSGGLAGSRGRRLLSGGHWLGGHGGVRGCVGACVC